jgi:hypothetical protein
MVMINKLCCLILEPKFEEAEPRGGVITQNYNR